MGDPIDPVARILSWDGGFLVVTLLCFAIWASVTAWVLTRPEP